MGMLHNYNDFSRRFKGTQLLNPCEVQLYVISATVFLSKTYK